MRIKECKWCVLSIISVGLIAFFNALLVEQTNYIHIYMFSLVIPVFFIIGSAARYIIYREFLWDFKRHNDDHETMPQRGAFTYLTIYSFTICYIFGYDWANNVYKSPSSDPTHHLVFIFFMLCLLWSGFFYNIASSLRFSPGFDGGVPVRSDTVSSAGRGIPKNR